jgi:8-amino-7-oxononanoate synthase
LTAPFVSERLAALRQRQLLRVPRILEYVDAVTARCDGEERLVFCGNDYLGLRRDPRVIEGARESARFGAGAGSSRLIAGSLGLHSALEEELADWLGVPAALLCPTGYQANGALIGGLAGRGDRVVSDALNHASIIDACRLSRAEVVVAPHGQTIEDLGGAGQRFVVLEGLYSMDGDRGALSHWAGQPGWMLVDEAHSLGVLGPGGRGVCDEQGVVPLARVGTFGKAFGAHGAFIATDRDTRSLVVNAGRPYVFTTGAPPPSVGAARAALRVVASAEGEQLRRTLEASSRRFRTEVRGLGCSVLGDADSPIVPVVVGSEERALRLAEQLWRRGIFAGAIRPPTVAPGTCRIRFTLSAAHHPRQIDRALQALRDALEEPG